LKTTIIQVILLFSIISCQENLEKSTKPDVKAEIEKWKRELLLNGEIGKPCNSDNQEEWTKNNPEVFYGLPDSINSKSFDANNDKINDILLYFPAGDCCCCSVGMNEGSDFVKLIFSNGNDYLTNDNLRTKIEQKIENKFYEQNSTEVQRAVFSITSFNTEISGTYQLWTKEDPDCCSSVEGTFKYNPFTFAIEITHKKAE